MTLGVRGCVSMLVGMERNWIRPMIFVAVMVAIVYGFTVIFSPSLGRPSEANRVRHPEGYSIIVPEAFTGRPILPRPGGRASGIEIQPKAQAGPTLSVAVQRHLDEPGTKLKWNDFPFQNQPAQAWEGPVGQQYEARIRFKRDDAWFLISVKMLAPQGVLRGQWMSFLNTFRYDPPATEAGSGGT